MSRRVRRTLAAGTLGAAAAATLWEVARRHDAARLAADPLQEVLERPAEGRPHQVRATDGTRLHVEVAGPDDAPAVVLVHGWGMSRRFWHHQVEALRPDHRVVMLDLRGHGRSAEAGEAGYTLRALADDLEVVLQELLSGHRPVLAGHSLGGMAALAWAQRCGDVRHRISGMLLANTACHDITAGLFAGMAVVEGVASRLGRRAIASRLPTPRRSTPLTHRLVRTAALGPGAAPAHVALTEQLFFECPVDARAGFGLALGSVDLAAAARTLDVPVRIVAGGRDRLIPPAFTRRLADEVPGAQLRVLPRAGHQAPLERHAEVTREIRELALASRAAATA